MAGGKDIKFGDDKRPVSVIPNSEQFLYNKASGQFLTDEYGNRLITKVDTYFIADATMAKATSVAFLDEDDKYATTQFSDIGNGLTALCGNYEVVTGLYGTDREVNVKQVNGTLVGVGTIVTTLDTNDSDVTWYDKDEATGLSASWETNTERDPSLCAKWPVIRTIEEQSGPRNKLYFDDLTTGNGIYGLGLKLNDKLSSDTSDVAVSAASTQYIDIGRNHIIAGTKIREISHNYRVVLNNELNIEGPTVGVRHNTSVSIRRGKAISRKSDATWKVEEQFPSTSEVSSTLLGVNRAETQLSLFSNVSSYGLDPDEFEIYSRTTSSYNFPKWSNRQNKIHGSRYGTRRLELTEESGVQIGSYPTPYTFPFGPTFARRGLYDESRYSNYKKFIQLGNDLYDIYSTNAEPYNTYPSDWKDNFLSKSVTKINGSEVEYTAGEVISFAQIDTWTETWVKLEKGELVNPVTNLSMNFNDINKVLDDYNKSNGTNYYKVVGDASWSEESLPGYGTGETHFIQMQSRRVFRYQPGRISGFTFGVKSSDEPRAGYFTEWGISNPTDEYMFRVRSGQLYIVRRSPIPLGADLLKKNGLKESAEVKIKDDISGLKGSGDPFREENEHYVTEISSDFFNGDPLDGTGRSEYNILASKVTMWKIEFGWYGAIGARFYAYIPAGAGEARWVVIHTLVIENQLPEPCLRDSYFRMAYRIYVTETSTFREPIQLTKYGASYYIDGGDEGTTTIHSVDSGETRITGSGEESLLAIKPKDVIISSTDREADREIINKKMIIPTQLNITTGALTKLSTVVCKGCPGFGYVYTPGVECGTPTDGKTISPTGTTFGEGGDRSGIIFSTATQMQIYGTDNTMYFTVDDIGAKVIAPSINNCYINSLEGKTTVGGEDRYDTANLSGYTSGFEFSGLTGNRSVAGPSFPVINQVTNQETTIPIGQGSPAGTNVYPYPIRLSQFTGIAASPYEFSGSKIEIQFLNPNKYDSYGHFADFVIGLSQWKPVKSGGVKLDREGANINAEFTNWTKNGILQTTVKETVITDQGSVLREVSNPPLREIIYGEHSQISASLSSEGVEVAEEWGTNVPPLRMASEYRVPVIPSPGGGRCSVLCIETEEPKTENRLKYIKNSYIDANGKPALDGTGTKQYFEMKIPFISFPSDVTFDGGEVALEEIDTSVIDPLTGTFKKSFIIPKANNESFYYVGSPKQYTVAGEGSQPSETFHYIEIKNGTFDSTLSSPLPNKNNEDDIAIGYRPVRAYSKDLQGNAYNPSDGSDRSNTMIYSRRLYDFNPFPLFLVIKMRDNAAVNGITVKETIGDTTKTITPPLYFLKENVSGTLTARATITDADGNANRNEASTHFGELERLSSAELENQNQAKLRSGYKVIDNIYIGADDPQTIDLSDVFGADRQAIVPDNSNTEATFFIAKRIDGSNAETTANMSLNFKEQ